MNPLKTLLTTAIAALALAGPALAEEDLPIGTADSKNLVQRTVTIDDQSYQVTEQTAIFDLAGRAMPLERVATKADFADAVEADRVTYAYDAADRVLVTLRAVKAPR